MTHSGSIVSLPHDLRVPFARYVARHGITLLRRYSIERVYREKKMFDSHPRELLECAFDIVTPTPNKLQPDGELLCILQEIINKFPSLNTKNYTIFLNHKKLLEGIILHCGIKDKKIEILNILAEVKVTIYLLFTFSVREGNYLSLLFLGCQVIQISNSYNIY